MIATATLTFDGLTIGSGDLRVVDLEGVWSTPEVRTSDVERSRADGMWAGQDLLGGRAITATLQASADLDSALWGQIQSALRPGGPERLLTVELSGFAGGRQVQSLCRVRRVSIPVDVERYQFGVPQVLVEFFASDPRFYDSNVTVVSAPVQAIGLPGLVFDAEFDLDFGGAGTGSGGSIVTNRGTYPAPWTLDVTGPAENVRIALPGVGVLRTVGVVNAGQTLRFDSLRRTITLNGASRYLFLQPGSVWFDLPPGASQVRWSAQSGTGVGTLSFRSAWV